MPQRTESGQVDREYQKNAARASHLRVRAIEMAAIYEHLSVTNSTPKRLQPLSRNIQIYRPQLTSVLSIANRISGIVLSLYAVALVVWLVAAAAGPHAYSTAQVFIGSWVGRILLFGCTFSFFLHLCGSIRHLIWDAGYGFELRTIYASGWTVVLVSSALTLLSWILSLLLAG